MSSPEPVVARPHDAPGVPAEIQIPNLPVSRFLDDAARRWPQRLAFDFWECPQHLVAFYAALRIGAGASRSGIRRA